MVIDQVAAQHMRSFINSVNGIRLEIGDLAADAAQVRLFAAGTFTLVPANAPFPPYAIALFVPGEITAPYRVGDAYASQPVGDLVIDVQKRPGSYVLTFPATIEPDVARSVQTVLPSDAGQLVLLATGFRVRY